MRIPAILIALLLLTAQAAAQVGGSSLRGTLLVADPRMAGSAFAETVILIVGNDAGGSLGVTVNRPTDTTLAEVLPGEFDASAQNYALYAGGPVAPRRLSILLHGDERHPGMDRILPQVAFTANAPLFDAILGNAPKPRDIRVIAGICGWGPNQLENEIANGDWHIVPADSGTIFSDNPQGLWGRLIERIDGNNEQLNSI